MTQYADADELLANARTAKGGKAVSKYIDVDVFIKSFREALPGLKAQVDPDLTPKAYAYLRGGEAIIEDLTKFPAADVVEVVRCKDCLYSTERYGHMECIHGVSYRNTWNKPDFFCSYGERKGGADNA